MSIYGAMFSGVSGLAAQSQALGMISDNISNLNTIGYKGSTARFQTLVTETGFSGKYSPGGVRTQPFQRIDQQGLLQNSASSTDLAIMGNGFFIVADRANAGIDKSFLFTRAGSFSVDSAGRLMSSSGFFLQGWKLDDNGGLPANAQLLNDLQTVAIPQITAAAVATNGITLGLNLPSQAAVDDIFQTTVQLFDKQGATQNLVVTWTKTATNQWNLAGTLAGTGLAKFADDGTATAMLDDGRTGSQFGSMAVADATAAFSSYTSVTAGSHTLTVDGTAVAYDDTMNLNTLATNINALAGISASVVGSRLVISKDDHTAMTLTDDDNLVSALDITQKEPPVDLGTLTFDANGSLATVVPGSFGTVNAAGGLSLFVDYDGTGGAGSLTDRQAITLDLGTLGTGDGVTQYASEFFTSQLDQNGRGIGAFAGISIDKEGIVKALFDNGQQRDIYKLPLAVFRNPNGLAAQNGNTYFATERSGDAVLAQANSAGAGIVTPNSLEASNIDLAEEFTNMIITQRAYSANAKVITTADEMLSELMQISR